MKYEWEKWHKSYLSGDVNIGTGFIIIEFNWPISFECYSHKYDGLPMRGLVFGFFAIRWGVTHEWQFK